MSHFLSRRTDSLDLLENGAYLILDKVSSAHRIVSYRIVPRFVVSPGDLSCQASDRLETNRTKGQACYHRRELKRTFPEDNQLFL